MGTHSVHSGSFSHFFLSTFPHTYPYTPFWRACAAGRRGLPAPRHMAGRQGRGCHGRTCSSPADFSLLLPPVLPSAFTVSQDVVVELGEQELLPAHTPAATRTSPIRRAHTRRTSLTNTNWLTAYDAAYLPQRNFNARRNKTIAQPQISQNSRCIQRRRPQQTKRHKAATKDVATGRTS